MSEVTNPKEVVEKISSTKDKIVRVFTKSSSVTPWVVVGMTSTIILLLGVVIWHELPYATIGKETTNNIKKFLQKHGSVVDHGMIRDGILPTPLPLGKATTVTVSWLIYALNNALMKKNVGGGQSKTEEVQKLSDKKFGIANPDVTGLPASGKQAVLEEKETTGDEDDVATEDAGDEGKESDEGSSPPQPISTPKPQTTQGHATNTEQKGKSSVDTKIGKNDFTSSPEPASLSQSRAKGSRPPPPLAQVEVRKMIEDHPDVYLSPTLAITESASQVKRGPKPLGNVVSF